MMSEQTKLKNKVEAYNNLHIFVNKLHPILQADYEANGIRVKSTGDLYKADKDRIKALILPFKDLVHNYHIQASKYGRDYYYLDANVSFADSDCTCKYADHQVYIGENHHGRKPSPLYTVEGVEIARLALKELKTQLGEIEDKIKKMKELAL